MEHDLTTPGRSGPDGGVPELIRRLADDSKRLAADEVRLAKMEIGEAMSVGVRGAMWLGVAFGVGVVAAVALTVFLASLIGRLAGGNYWVGALAVAVVELVAALLLIKRGVRAYGGIDFTFTRSREALRDSAEWAKDAGRAMKAELTRQPEEVRAALREGLAETAHRPPRAD